MLEAFNEAIIKDDIVDDTREDDTTALEATFGMLIGPAEAEEPLDAVLPGALPAVINLPGH